MKEVKVKFVIEDVADECSMRRFMHGEEAIFMLHDFAAKLRELNKYESDETLTPGIEKVTTDFYALLEEYSLNLDDLVR